jgi:hypothetical protein
MVMKGQYRIVGEILIFAIGIAITSFVIVSFQKVSDSVSRISIEDQLTSVSNLLSSGIVKAAGTDSTIRLNIPREVSGMVYRISVKDDTIIISTANNLVSVSKQIFNIGHPYIISGDVFSSAEYIDIVSSDSNIMIKRSDF